MKSRIPAPRRHRLSGGFPNDPGLPEAFPPVVARTSTGASFMKTIRQSPSLLGMLCSLLLMAWAVPRALAADAKPPGKMAFQGFLTDGNGTARGLASPVNLSVTFRIYDSPTAAAAEAIWAESQVVTVDKGHFSVVLGEGTAISGGADLSPHFIGDNVNGRYLGITVGSENEIAPRIQFLASPYSHLARYATELVGTSGSSVLKVGAGQVGINLSGSPTSELDVGGTVKSTALVINGPTTVTGTSTVHGTSTINGATTFNGPVAISGNNFLHLGSGIAGKQGDAGKIGYGLWTADALDIVGGGVNQFTRAVKVWAEGGTSFSGPVTAVNFVGSGDGLINVPKLSLENTFTGRQNFQNHVRIGELITTIGNAGWGEALIFSGAPPMSPGWDSDNSDPVWMARYNTGANSSELRMVVGDDSGSAGDRFVLGAMVGSGGFSQGATWTPKFAVDTSGMIELRPDLAGTKEASAGKIGYGTFTADTLDIVGAGNSVAARKIKMWAEGGMILAGTFRVAGATAASQFQLEAVMDPFGPRDIPNQAHTLSYGLLVDNRVRAAAYDVVSDSRIKNVIGQTDGAKDLETLRKISVTDYTFKDRYSHGNRAEKKVVAQQVESVFPMAVTQASGVVPDLFERSRAEGGWVRLQAELKAGERVRIISKNADNTYAVKSVSNRKTAKGEEKRYSFEPSLEDAEVFVYGREVSDLRAVDYQAIGMLNVSATQELSRRLEKQETELAELRGKLAKALGDKQALVDSLSDLGARLLRLEASVKQQAAIGPSPDETGTALAGVVHRSAEVVGTR